MTQTRAILLKIMLAAVALAAVGGALAFLVAEMDWAWRLVGVAIATGIAAGLLLAGLAAAGRSHLRIPGLLFACLVLLEYLGALFSLLVQPLMQQFYSAFAPDDWRMPLTMLALAGVGAPFIVASAGLTRRDARLAAIIGMTVAAVAGICWLIAAWVPYGLTFADSEMWGVTGYFVLMFGLFGALALLGWKPPALGLWRWPGVAAAAAGLATATYGTWASWSNWDDAWFTWSLLTLAIVAAHAAATSYPALRGLHVWLQRVAIALGLISGISLILGLLVDEFGGPMVRDVDDAFVRLAGATGVLAGCGTLAVIILARFQRADRPVVESRDIKQVSLTCPRCGSKQTLPVGGGRCAQCLLFIQVRLAEPRCPQCDYLLYGASDGKCPECGAAVANLPMPILEPVAAASQ
ncbi:MAG: hypothetical protein WD042_10590 [Phycisphaeraceae bacterium]